MKYGRGVGAGHARLYEQFGIEGLKVFKKTVDYCKEKGLVVIGDIKRGDIGSTSTAYAVGHIGKVQVGSKTYAGFDEDFITVNPYLGTDGIKPFVDVCKEENKGVLRQLVHFITSVSLCQELF